MHRFRYDLYSSLNQKLIDAVVTGASFYLAYQIRFNWHVPSSSAQQMWLLLPAVVAGRVLVNWASRMYRLIWRYISLSDAIMVFRSYLGFSAILLALRLSMPDQLAVLKVPLSIIIIEFLLSVQGALGVRGFRRLLYEAAAARSPDSRNPVTVLLIGAGQAGIQVSKGIASRTDINPIGFLDDDPKKVRTLINGIPVIGPLSSLASAIQKYKVDEVIICLPCPPRALLKTVWAICDQHAIRAKIVPTLEEILGGKVNIAVFRNIEMTDLLSRDAIGLSLTEPEVISVYQGKRILITGAGGSIGSELAYQLSKLGPGQLVLLDKDENGLHDTYLRIEAETKNAEIFPVVADIRSRERLQSIFSMFRPEAIFHAAAHKHVYLMEMNPCEAILNNVVGTRNLVEQSAANGVTRFVLISTDKAVRPTSVMGASKRVCEMIVEAQQDHGRSQFCSVRFGNVLGSRGSVVPIFRKQIERGGPVTVTHADARRYLMTIPEAVCLLVRAGTLGESGEIFVLDMGEPALVQNLARDLIELSGLRPGHDIEIQITKLRHGEKLNEILFDHETEKLLPTRLEKIHVISSQTRIPGDLGNKLDALEKAARQGLTNEIYRNLCAMNIDLQQLDEGESEPSPSKTAIA